MARRKCRMVYSPVTGRMVRRCSGTRRRSLSGLGSFGQAGGLKGSLSSVKSVLITGAIAAGGAIVTRKVYAKIGKSLNLAGYQAALAEMATGIALGMVIAKVLKKPRLAAAFAIGPVVSGAITIFGDVVSSNAVSGLGLTAFDTVNPYSSMYAPLSNAGIGSTVQYSQTNPGGYPGYTPPAPKKQWVMGAY